MNFYLKSYKGDIGQWESDGALRIIDRKKDLCKMRHGEYIALGKVESTLKTSAAIANLVVYGSGDILFPGMVWHLAGRQIDLFQFSYI